MVDKMRVGLALQPIATALFANSPFTEGKPNGFLSCRSEIWRDTDNAPHRHAALRLRATASASSPMSTGRSTCRCISSMRDGRYHDMTALHVPRVPGRAGCRTTCPSRAPTMGDWKNHLSTLFPEVRLKTLSRDARRRWRPVAPALRAAGLLDRPPLRRDVARRRQGRSSATGRRKSARRCATRSRDPASPRRSATAPSSTSPARRSSIARDGPASPRRRRQRLARRDRLPRPAGGDARRSAAPRPKACSANTKPAGATTSNRYSWNGPTEAHTAFSPAEFRHQGISLVPARALAQVSTTLIRRTRWPSRQFAPRSSPSRPATSPSSPPRCSSGAPPGWR